MPFKTAAGTARALCTVLLFTIWACVAAGAQEAPDFGEMMKVARASAPLNGEERAAAVALAEQALRSNRLLPDRRTFLTWAETYRDTVAERRGSFERGALLTYYRYDGDVALHVYVNLVRRRVTNVERLAHHPTPLAPEELRRARELALEHPELKKAFDPYRERLVIEPLSTGVPSPKYPLFGHRLVYLLFRVGARYLTAQGEVLVDLTTEKVIIRPARNGQGSAPHH
jgi:hypothetical protein